MNTLTVRSRELKKFGPRPDERPLHSSYWIEGMFPKFYDHMHMEAYYDVRSKPALRTFLPETL